MKLESIGLIVNPAAGRGAQRNLDVARRAMDALGVYAVITGPEQLGGLAAPEADIVPVADLTGRAATQHIAQEAARAGVDALVVVGGDGTLADVAFALMESGLRCPVLGVGAGSVNAGSLVTCRAEEVPSLAGAELTVEPIDALVAGCNDQTLALAFNDVVIGATVVGTLEGTVRDLDAAAFLAGKRVVGHPQTVGTPLSVVVKLSGDRAIEIARGAQIGTVIVGFAHADCFFGKAIVGGVCLTALVGLPAGCLVCEQPLVRTQLDAQDLAAAEPVHSAYVSLASSEQIQVTGLGPPAVLCADGNPLQRLTPADRVQIGVRPRVVGVLRVIG